MAMNGRVKRFVEVGPETVARALIDDEIHYLTVPEAGPDEVKLLQEEVPAFAPSYLRRVLDKAVVVKFRDGIIKKYVMPESRKIASLVREERDYVISSHVRSDNGFIYGRLTGLPCDVADFEAHINACNRVMEMLWVRGNGSRVY